MDLEFLLLYLALCLVAGIAGRNRRIGFWGYFFASVIFTPFIGLLFLYFASPRKDAPASHNRPATSRGNKS